MILLTLPNKFVWVNENNIDMFLNEHSILKNTSATEQYNKLKKIYDNNTKN